MGCESCIDIVHILHQCGTLVKLSTVENTNWIVASFQAIQAHGEVWSFFQCIAVQSVNIVCAIKSLVECFTPETMRGILKKPTAPVLASFIFRCIGLVFVCLHGEVPSVGVGICSRLASSLAAVSTRLYQ